MGDTELMPHSCGAAAEVEELKFPGSEHPLQYRVCCTGKMCGSWLGNFKSRSVAIYVWNDRAIRIKLSLIYAPEQIRFDAPIKERDTL